MTKEEEKYTTLDIEQCEWWVNTLFGIAKEKACNSHNFDDGEEIQAAQNKIIKALEQNEELQKENEDFQKYIDKANHTNSQLIQIIEKHKMQQPSDETIKYLECNDIDVQEFTEAMKKQRLQVIKPNICDDCVSRANLLKKFEDRFIELQKAHQIDKQLGVNWCINTLNELPPVTPTQCIATVRFSREDLREICNERIEIECTHGTCKDCENWDKECHYCFMLDCDTGKDFYCKGFEKRGNENE